MEGGGLIERVGDAGSPQLHAQSRQWCSILQGLVFEPGMCTKHVYKQHKHVSRVEGEKGTEGEEVDRRKHDFQAAFYRL